MRFLADDLLEGRETGTRGFDIAAEYVAAQFRAAGLQTSMQPIRFRAATVAEQSMSLNATALTARKDFVLSPSFDQQVVDVTAPTALAGFGVVAPVLSEEAPASPAAAPAAAMPIALAANAKALV